MKKRDLKYVIILIMMFFIYIMVELFTPSTVNWSETFDESHKSPYGTYAMNSLLPDLFQGYEIQYSNNSLYELKQSDSLFQNLIIITRWFNLHEEDEKALWQMLNNGKNILIAANWYRGSLFDSLGVGVSHSITRRFVSSDTTKVYMNEASRFTEKGPFKYLPNHASMYFYSYDSSRAEIWARESNKDAVLIRFKHGTGSLVLSTLPMAFTNYYLLKEKNHHFVSNAFSLLPEGNVHFTNFYHYGRLEPVSKLRFILVTPPLKWAYYLAIGGVVVFLVFGSKRTQKAIPMMIPPRNSTLDFIGIMGNLYFNQGNNKNMATKKIAYFLDHVRQKYYLKTDVMDEDFINRLAIKSNRNVEDVKKLVSLILWVEQRKTLSDNALIDLNNRIEDFYFN